MLSSSPSLCNFSTMEIQSPPVRQNGQNAHFQQNKSRDVEHCRVGWLAPLTEANQVTVMFPRNKCAAMLILLLMHRRMCFLTFVCFGRCFRTDTVRAAGQGHAEPRGRSHGDLEALGGTDARGRRPRQGVFDILYLVSVWGCVWSNYACVSTVP